MLKLKSLYRSELFLCLGLVFLFILVESLTTNKHFFQSHAGWIDHWLYLGQFEYGAVLSPTHMDNYKASRLIWIWQGGLIFRNTDQSYFNYIIVITSLLKFWLAFWLVSRRYLLEKSNLFFYLSVFLFYPTLMENGGWYYHNFESCTWWLLAIWILKRIEDKELDYKCVVWAGIFAGFSINVNLFHINFLPMFVVLTPRLFFERKWTIIFAVIGLILSIVCLGLINLSLGGDFDYYRPMLEMIKRFDGNHSLWKPLLYTESFPLLVLISVVTIYFSVQRAIKKLYSPLSIAFLYSALVYLFWHLRGVEVLAVHIHNAFLLMMAFLALIEVSETLFRPKINWKLTLFSFVFTWWAIHFIPGAKSTLEYYFYFEYQRILICTLVLGIVVYSLFVFKSRKLCFVLFLFFPYSMAKFQVSSDFKGERSVCYGKKTYGDIIFSMKNEMSTISELMILERPEHSEVASAIEAIGNYNIWPRKDYFTEECRFGPKGSTSLDYKYKAVIAETGKVSLDNHRCREWNDYKKLILHKEFEICDGHKIQLSILSTD